MATPAGAGVIHRQPTYERDTDRAVQEVVFQFLRLRSKLKDGKVARLAVTDPGATVDYIWDVNGRIVAAGELKRRNIQHDTFPSLMISASKVLELQRMAEYGYLLILYRDGLWYHEVQRGRQYDIGMGGRTTKSRDNVDAAGERCVWLPIAELAPMPAWTDWWTNVAWQTAREMR